MPVLPRSLPFPALPSASTWAHTPCRHPTTGPLSSTSGSQFLLLPSTSRQASLGLSHPWGSSGLAGRDLVTLGLLSFWQSSLGGTRTAQGGLWALPYLTVMQDSRIFFLLFSSFSLFFLFEKAPWRRGATLNVLCHLRETCPSPLVFCFCITISLINTMVCHY